MLYSERLLTHSQVKMFHKIMNALPDLPEFGKSSIRPGDERSAYFVATYPEFMNFSAQEVQNIFKTRHILVTGCPLPDKYDWDERTMSRLAPLNSNVPMQG